MNELKPLPKFITKEIRRILTGCQTGKLGHDQYVVHYGTNHCIAGWKAVFDAKKVVGNCVVTAVFPHDDIIPDRIEDCDLRAFTDSDKYNTSSDWCYAQDQWRLTAKEAAMLFKADATFEEQFGLLERLERGERIE